MYLLVDTSGTYARELDKAQQVINYLLGTLKPGDSLAVARVKSGSFSEKDTLAKATFAKDPLQANGQSRAFKEQMRKLAEQTRAAAPTPTSAAASCRPPSSCTKLVPGARSA